MKTNITRISLVLLLFIFLYMPPIFPRLSVTVWGLFFFLCCIKRGARIRGKHISVFVGGLVIVLWSLLVDIYNNGFSADIMKVHMTEILMLFYLPVGICLVIEIIDQYGYSKKQVLGAIVHAGILQGLMAIAAYVINPVQSLFCWFIQNVMGMENVTYWKEYRLYGLSLGMTYAMPILQGLMGALCFGYAVKYSKNYLLAVPLIWFSGIINARVCLVVVAIEMLVWLLAYRIKNTSCMKAYLFAVEFGLLSALMVAFFLLLNGIVKAPRITDPIKELLSIMRHDYVGETNGYFSYFFVNENVLSIPSDNNIIFGLGKSLLKSDVGYIADLWTGGVVFSACLFAYYVGLFTKWKEMCDEKMEYLWVVIMCATLFVVNIKGDSFLGVSEFINLLFLCIAISDYYSKQRIRKCE